MAEIHGARNVHPTPTFNQIVQNFQGKTDDKHIRFSNKKQLHVHTGATSGGKPSGVGKDAAKERATKQSAGARVVKDAIRSEYGDAMADAVFNMPGRGGTDLNKGVTVRDL